jgi:hypothetical protein
MQETYGVAREIGPVSGKIVIFARRKQGGKIVRASQTFWIALSPTKEGSHTEGAEEAEWFSPLPLLPLRETRFFWGSG